MPTPQLVLASASPRRRELLRALGLEFEAIVPEVEELAEGDPAELVLENARRKARAGLERFAADRPRAGEDRGLLVLGVDTDVALDGRLLGKPATEAESRQRLEALSGRTHEVWSGVALLAIGDLFSEGESKWPQTAAEAAERSGTAVSRVTFNDLDRQTIDLYLASGEWRDRAGGYAIQGLGSLLVAGVQGDFANVVGLPLALLLDLAPKLRDTL